MILKKLTVTTWLKCIWEHPAISYLFIKNILYTSITYNLMAKQTRKWTNMCNNSKNTRHNEAGQGRLPVGKDT